MRKKLGSRQPIFNKRGVSLIELMIALAFCGIVIGSIYRVFISHTRIYAVQDEVVEVQQSIRGAMEILLRDLRMAGFQTSTFGSGLITSGAIIVDPNNNSHITVNYEYMGGAAPTVYTVDYIVDNQGNLNRTLTPAGSPAVKETILENVKTLTFTYGIDANGDGIIDGIDTATGLTPDSAFVSAANVGTAKVLAIRVFLVANPSPVNPDVTTMVSPRTLTSVVTPRNLLIKKYQAY